MDLFYKYKKYNLTDFKYQIKNVKLLELFEDQFCLEGKPKGLKYFKEPQLSTYPLNLNEGYEQHRFRKIELFYDKPLSKVINWDVKHGNADNIHEDKGSIFVYTHRHAIVKIIQSHFYKGGPKWLDFDFYVTKLGNKLYLHLEAYKIPESKQNPYHYKLEQMVFSDSPFTEPKTDVPVDENIRLSAIYRCQLGKFNLFYTAEVQGIISDIEIKDTYFNNILVNIDATYWAYRDENGYVYDPIKPLKNSDMCKNMNWNPKEYEQFLYDFLSLIVEKMSDVNCLDTTYEFNYKAGDKAVYYKVHEGKSDKSFLSDDYIQFMRKKNDLLNLLNE